MDNITLTQIKTIAPKKFGYGTPLNRHIFGFDIKYSENENKDSKLEKCEKEHYAS